MTCKIASHFSLSDADVFWIKNGFDKLSYSKIGKHSDGGRLFQLASIELSPSANDSYGYQGSYQCSVFVEKFMKKELTSPKLHIQVQGNFLML